MLEHLIKIDQDIFLFLNGLHINGLDQLMFWISGKKEWIPLYALIVGVIIYNYKKKSILIILGIVISIILADQITSGFMKPFFERLRPSHEPLLEGLVHHVNNYKGGRFGFASSHAANSFALAMYLWLLFRHHYKWSIWIFVWASVVSYSRIYLGVHYPGDIIVGALVGAASGWGSYHLITHIAKTKSINKFFHRTQ